MRSVYVGGSDVKSDLDHEERTQGAQELILCHRGRC